MLTTHFHTDHVGWNTRWEQGRWVPTFPNARYVMSEKEWTYWSAMHKETPQNQIADSVIPIVEELGKPLLLVHGMADSVRTAVLVAPGRYELVSATPVGNYALKLAWADGHADGIYTWELLRSLEEGAGP